MPISSSYRLPGVYSQELSNSRVVLSTGGYATVAFVGPAVGYIVGSQQSVMSVGRQLALNVDGILDGSVTVRSRTTGATFSAGSDYIVENGGLDGKTRLSLKPTSLSPDVEDVSGLQLRFVGSRPRMGVVVDDGGNPVDGYVVAGTLSVRKKGARSDLVEGVDYTFDYFNGELIAKTGGALSNGDELSVSYKRTLAEPLALSGTRAYALQHRYPLRNGYNDGGTSVSAKIVFWDGDSGKLDSTPGSTTEGYVEGADYEIDYSTGKIARVADSRIPSFDSAKANYAYVAFSYCAIKPGEYLDITYRYTGDDYYDPRIVESYENAVDYFGEPWDRSTGEVLSPLSVAAYIGARNGMGAFVGVPVRGQSDSDGNVSYTNLAWSEAFDALLSMDGVDIVVPLSADEGVWSLAQSYLSNAAGNQQEAIAILGFDGTETVVSPEKMSSQAQTFDNDSIVLVAPSTFRFRNPVTSSVDICPGWYAAIAIGGYLSSVPQYTPLTRKTLNGIFSANEYYTKLRKANMCNSGLCYVDEYNQGIRILHGKTTSQGGIAKQESNVVLTKYYIIKQMRDMFDTGYIGEPITPSTPSFIAADATSLLATLQQDSYIYSYGSVNASISDSNPTEIDLSFSYRPTYSLNYIVISFSVESNGVATATSSGNGDW